MTRPRSWGPYVAWGMGALTLACFATILIWSRSGPADGSAEAGQIAALIVYVFLELTFTTVGVVVASRVPRNAIGWLCLAMAFLPAVGGLGDEYVIHALGPDVLPAAGYVAATQSAWNAFIALPAFLMLLFPTGRPPSKRWRPVLYALSAGLVLVLFADLVKPQTDYKGLANPLAVEAVKGALPVLEIVGTLCIVASILLSFLSLVFRYRAARTEERQQVKLLAYSLVVIVLGFAVAATLEGFGHEEASNAVLSGSIISIPIAIAFAVLKHRLYEIDVIINRTLVYAVLTGVLAVVYVGMVFGFQALLAPFTAESDLAIAGSTLAVAALFRPARSRVQAFIDHRFYRRKFDAQRTLDDFGSTLRDEVDLSSLSSRLTGVVTDTMQPRHVSLWLRERRGTT